MNNITKKQLLDERSDLLKQLEFVEGMLKLRFGWSPPDAVSVTETLNRSNDSNSFFRNDALGEEDHIRYREEANNWIEEVSGNVTAKNFGSWLAEKHPDKSVNRNSLNAPIKLLVDEGKLAIVRRGAGKIPSIYRVVNDDQRE